MAIAARKKLGLAPLDPPYVSARGPACTRVVFAGKAAGAVAPGGGEIQMSSLARALAAAGVCVRFCMAGEEGLARADCLHLFGSLREHLPLVAAARRRGLPVVLSPIAWFSLRAYWEEGGSMPGRLAACGRFLARSALPQLPSWRRRLYHAVDLLMPNSQAEAEQLAGYFDVPGQRILPVPNGAEARFSAADPAAFVARYHLRDFVLCAGRIEPRKNQLGLLRALRGLHRPIVLIGQPVPGHEAYLAQCRREAGPHAHFVGRLDHHDPLLAAAYAACGCLVLPSWYETPGLAALEAAMTGTPLVLTRAGCANEYFGPYASYIDPGSSGAIRRGVLAGLRAKRNPALADHVRRHFSWTCAARVTLDGYQRAITQAQITDKESVQNEKCNVRNTN